MSKIPYRVADKSLFVGYDNENESRIDFGWSIAEVLDCGNVLVIRLEPEPGAKDNENIFGVDGTAAILWQVEKRKYVYDDSPFTGMKKSGEHVHLYNWDGTELVVNAMTGEIVQETYGR